VASHQAGSISSCWFRPAEDRRTGGDVCRTRHPARSAASPGRRPVTLGCGQWRLENGANTESSPAFHPASKPLSVGIEGLCGGKRHGHIPSLLRTRNRFPTVGCHLSWTSRSLSQTANAAPSRPNVLFCAAEGVGRVSWSSWTGTRRRWIARGPDPSPAMATLPRQCAHRRLLIPTGRPRFAVDVPTTQAACTGTCLCSVAHILGLTMWDFPWGAMVATVSWWLGLGSDGHRPRRTGRRGTS